MSTPYTGSKATVDVLFVRNIGCVVEEIEIDDSGGSWNGFFEAKNRSHAPQLSSNLQKNFSSTIHHSNEHPSYFSESFCTLDDSCSSQRHQ